jgi:hypothetical protein
MALNEILLIGGPLDGLSLNANDDTMDWPIVITFEMLIDDGVTPTGADEIPSGIVRVNKVRYTIINAGEDSKGDTFSQYMHDGTEEESYDTNKYVDDPTDPFHPDNVDT